MMRTRWIAAACAAMTFATAGAADVLGMADLDAPTDTLPLQLARAVADKTIELVEARAVYPRRQAEYDAAKAALLAEVDGHADMVDRQALHGRIKALLLTLDADGHSFIMAAPPRPKEPSVKWDIDLHPSTFKRVATSRGTVLRWVPPAIIDPWGSVAATNYLKAFYNEAAARPDIQDACALVVDLSAQTGGSAWPPFVAMYPLFGDANKANWVGRDGARKPFVKRADLEAMARPMAAGRANPLAPYATGPLAVVVGDHTASAGEMLLVALLGEERVQTFGQTSYGLSTANSTNLLPDGSLLFLTESRYALGDGPVYRSGIAAMHPAQKGATVDVAVHMAAEWAAANSPRCQAAQPAVAAASLRDQ